MRAFINLVGDILDVLSGEYLLTRIGYPNGGTVVFLRTAHVTVIVFALALGAINLLDPARTFEFSGAELRAQILDRVTWIGAIFATVYALLYARFASQFTYLAGVYNQIKAAQARADADVIALAEWRAGFIEDCEDLHLLRKPMFSSIVRAILTSADAYGTDAREAFIKYSPGGQARLDKIMREVTGVVDRVTKQYGGTTPAAPAAPAAPTALGK